MKKTGNFWLDKIEDEKTWMGFTDIGNGFFYCPYILPKEEIVIKASDFTPRAGIMVRYGKKLINSNLYKRITLKRDER